MILNAADHVDWVRSESYCRSVSSLGIRCNVDGRDPDGVIPLDEFESVREELVDGLKNVRAPDGESVFETVYDRHERHGSDVANERSAPDVVVRPNRMRWKVTDVIREPIFESTDEFSHTYEGMFAVAGPSVNPDMDMELNAIAIAPLVLRAFGYRSPPVMNGETPPRLLNAEAHMCPPEPETRVYLSEDTKEETDTVTERLQQLGYLK